MTNRPLYCETEQYSISSGSHTFIHIFSQSRLLSSQYTPVPSKQYLKTGARSHLLPHHGSCLDFYREVEIRFIHSTRRVEVCKFGSRCSSLGYDGPMRPRMIFIALRARFRMSCATYGRASSVVSGTYKYFTAACIMCVHVVLRVF